MIRRTWLLALDAGASPSEPREGHSPVGGCHEKGCYAVTACTWRHGATEAIIVSVRWH